ncbi:hypothetical protein, partial [Streptomyces roseolus]|uniref:hypothetical protein n=1 Tax=Streptomyces roseolus TaxID=67358 RepID=UPI00364C524E
RGMGTDPVKLLTGNLQVKPQEDGAGRNWRSYNESHKLPVSNLLAVTIRANRGRGLTTTARVASKKRKVAT